MHRSFVRLVKRSFATLTLVAVVASIASGPAITLAASDRAKARFGPVHTWLLSTASELRLGPPPDAAATRAEQDQLQTLAEQRDAATLDRISYWDAGAPPHRWTERAVKYGQSHGLSGLRALRLTALMNVAISDAVAAATDSQQTYNRARPALASAAIAAPTTPGYPDERAAAAGAAEVVLAYVFPSDADLFTTWAAEAAHSRVDAGVAYPSDSTAGLDLGRNVGERAVAWGHSDGSDAKWTGSVPTDRGKWNGTNPVEPLAGTWRPWALTSGSQFRPGPPPDVDSEQMTRDLAEVKSYSRTNATNLIASFWEYMGGRAGSEYWNDQTSRLIFEHRMQDDALLASRLYAIVNAALVDGDIACYDASTHTGKRGRGCSIRPSPPSS
jgi:hypothetical protein